MFRSYISSYIIPTELEQRWNTVSVRNVLFAYGARGRHLFCHTATLLTYNLAVVI
jgi:hypothetical protein